MGNCTFGPISECSFVGGRRMAGNSAPPSRNRQMTPATAVSRSLRSYDDAYRVGGDGALEPLQTYAVGARPMWVSVLELTG